MVSGFKKDKKNKKKEKLVFAKDKKQAITALVVLCLFVGNTIFMLIKGYMEQNPPAAKAPSPAESELAQDIAKQQQQNLESLNNTTGTTATDPNLLAQDANNIYTQTLDMQGQGTTPQTVANPTKTDDDIEIMSKKFDKSNRGKMVTISITNSESYNPFLPANEKFVSSSNLSYLSSPPETLPVDSDAQKIMTTTISGILYDKYSPSAIINMEGSDYLVKKGDIINKYRVLAITKNQVTVQLGKNIYQAGVGELLSQTNINYNTVANLNKKFGGNEVSINVKKKNY